MRHRFIAKLSLSYRSGPEAAGFVYVHASANGPVRVADATRPQRVIKVRMCGNNILRQVGQRTLSDWEGPRRVRALAPLDCGEANACARQGTAAVSPLRPSHASPSARRCNPPGWRYALSLAVVGGLLRQAPRGGVPLPR